MNFVRSSVSSLIGVPEHPHRWYEVIFWWEVRRVVYNIILGIVGVSSLLLFLYIDTLPPRLPPEQLDFEYLFAAVAGAVAANLFYTGGWSSELFLRWTAQREVRWFAPRAYTVGILFSIAVVLTPVVINGLAWLSRAAASAGT